MENVVLRGLRSSAPLLGLVALAFLPGCASWNLRGPNFSDDLARMGENLRPLDPNSNAWSFTSKGRQIERDLGVGDP